MYKVFNPISPGNPVIELRSKVWGMYLDSSTTQGLKSVSESQLHINKLELKVGGAQNPQAVTKLLMTYGTGA